MLLLIAGTMFFVAMLLLLLDYVVESAEIDMIRPAGILIFISLALVLCNTLKSL